MTYLTEHTRQFPASSLIFQIIRVLNPSGRIFSETLVQLQLSLLLVTFQSTSSPQCVVEKGGGGFEGRGLWLDMVVWTIKVLQYWWQWPCHPKKTCTARNGTSLSLNSDHDSCCLLRTFAV